MARDETLEFIKSFADRFVQFKGLQFQQELLRRREERYDQQLQENRRYRQRQISISQEHLELRKRYTTAYEQGKSQSNINVTTPFSKTDIVGTSQTQGVDDIIAEELSNVPMDTSDWLGWGEGTNIYKQSDIDAARQKAQERVRVMFAGKGGGGEQFDYLWNSQLGELKNPESGRNVEIREQEADKKVFQGTQLSRPKVTGGFLGRKESEFPAGFETVPGKNSYKLPPRPKDKNEADIWGNFTNAWFGFEPKLQKAILIRLERGMKWSEIAQFDEVRESLQDLVK